MSTLKHLPELAALGVDAYLDPDLRLRVLSSAQLRARSRGEVEKPETINYRTKKPERGGLHCARIFGPIEDLCCICTKYRGEQHRGVRCEKCGVEVLESSVRSERFGHIELALPLVHPLLRAEIGRLLGITPAQLQQVIAGHAGLEGGQLVGEDALTQPGGPSLRAALAAIDVQRMFEDPVLVGLAEYLDPAQLMLECILVLPAGLRPLEELEDGRLASGDLNDLYRRVVNRNSRLRRLLELNAPLIILHNEYRMLQASVDCLFINEQLDEPIVHRRRVLESLAGYAGRLGYPIELGGVGEIFARGVEGLPAPASSVATTRTRSASSPLVTGAEDDYDF